MKAFTVNEPGDTSRLQLTELPVPAITDDEVLIRVKAISINPVDVKTRAGKGIYGRIKDQRPLIPGWDVLGIVSEVGKHVTQFKPGEEVFGMVNFPGHGKAYAEYVAAPATHLAHKPQNISHAEAAAATLAALTAWQALVHTVNVKPGDKVLIHAAAGGVGHYAVQIAKHLGASVIGTSSLANKDFVLSLGADEHLDYQAQPFEAVVADADVVLDAAGGETTFRSLDALKPGGRLVGILGGGNEAFLEKAQAKHIDAKFILVQSNGDDMAQLADLLAKGILKSHVSHTFPFEQMAAAHAHVETGRTVGKVVVVL